MKSLLSVFASIGLTGCLGALSASPGGTQLRYFSPDDGVVRTTSVVIAQPALPQMRLGRVTSSASLRSRIVRHEPGHELAMYETLRWTDDPDAYIRRALARTLFDDGQAQEMTGGDAPTLEVEVLAFEEVSSKHARGGRVELRYELRDDQRVLASGIAASERRAEGTSMDAIVAAIGGAMNDAVTDLTRNVLVAVKRR
jgi:ABC-type uncharacterized transport system auxiliary subunit